VVVDGQTLQPFGPPQSTASAVYHVNDPAQGENEQARLLRVLTAYQDRPGVAQLNGVLGVSNELSTFEPIVHDPQTAPEYEAAYEWIGTQSAVIPGLNPDLRWAYVNNRDLDGGWSDQIGYLEQVDCPSDRSDFSQTVCQAVVGELILEGGWISPVVGFFDAIEKPLSLASGSSYADLGAQLADIEKDLPAPSSSDVEGDVLEVQAQFWARELDPQSLSGSFMTACDQ